MLSIKEINLLEAQNKGLKKQNKELQHYLACMTEQRNKANTCLQKIKEICKMDCGDCQYNQDCDCNFEECEEAKIDDILQLITKAESEG